MGCKCLVPNSKNELEIESEISHKDILKKGTNIIENDKDKDNELIINDENIPKINTKKMFIKKLNLEQDREEPESNNSNIYYEKDKEELDKIPQELPKDIFSQYIYEEINKLRKNPQYIIPMIEEAKGKITKELVKRKDKDEEERFVFKGNVKVALCEGTGAFDKAIEALKQINPMEPLLYSKFISIPIPNTEEEIIDKYYEKSCVNKINQESNSISSYWRDNVNNAETSFLLMIVDDTGKRNGIRRNDILNPDFKYIGISSNKINKSFACYITFGK